MKKHIALFILFTICITLACSTLSPTTQSQPTVTAPIKPPTEVAPQDPPTENGGDKDISGTYTLEGTNFDGTVYIGEVKITQASGNSYDLTWTIGQQQSQSGTAIFDGTQLTGRWQEGQNSGDIIYTLQPDGSLTGTWTVDGVNDQGTEVLVLKK